MPTSGFPGSSSALPGNGYSGERDREFRERDRPFRFIVTDLPRIPESAVTILEPSVTLDRNTQPIAALRTTGFRLGACEPFRAIEANCPPLLFNRSEPQDGAGFAGVRQRARAAIRQRG